MPADRRRLAANHKLEMKVMRLTRPSLQMSQPVLYSHNETFHDCFLEAQRQDLATVTGLESFALGELLTLPQNFGNIFLGETFSSYISVHNDSNQACREVIVKADLQTGSQRLSLSDGVIQPVPSLGPDQSIDDVIHHEVKELGTHILVCAVSYLTQSGEKMYFRKFFKFQVLKPLDVKTKFYNAESDVVYLEAQISNITPGPIYMEKVSLEAQQPYNVQELNTANDSNKDESKSVFGKVNYINPLDTRQYLYCLTQAKNPKPLVGLTNVGKLDIVWKTNMGEKGRLQTSQLQRMAPGYGDIKLTVDSVPDAVSLDTTFKFSCKVTNCCERTMDLVLVLQNENSSGLVWCDNSGRRVGELAAGSHVTLDLSLLALKTGLQSITGLRLTDSFLKRTYEHDEITQVYVYSQDD